MNAGELARVLARDAERVCRHLLPNGKKQGAEWCVGDTQGGDGQSCKVHLIGDKAGLWSDFATGQSGDLLDLWTANQGVTLADAIRQAKSFAGIAEADDIRIKSKQHRRPEPPRKARSAQPDSPVMAYLKSRGLTEATIRKYRIAEQAPGVSFHKLADNPGTVVFPSFRGGELVNVKYLALARPNGKKQTFVEGGCEPCLFGWQAMPDNARALVLTEGEIDAMTLSQFGMHALSVPFGGGAGDKQRWIEYEYPHLERFDKIFLCFDQDDEGRAATDAVIDRLGRERCQVIDLPHKDANECLMQGFELKDFAKCFAEARSLDPDELKSAGYFAEAVMDEFFPPTNKPVGMLSPWPKAKEMLMFRPSEVTIWTGYNGQGKSQVLGHVIVAGMHQGERACIASMEMPGQRTLARMVRQATGMERPSQLYIRTAIDWMAERLWLFHVLGGAKAERLLEVFAYARKRYAVTQFVVDSLAKCGIAEDDYVGQKAFVEQLVDFSHRHQCHVHLVAHSRKGMDEFSAPGKMDVKGTGAITDMVDNVITIWRNKRKEQAVAKAQAEGVDIDPDTLSRPDASAIISKQRYNGLEGELYLWFDKEALQYVGNPEHRPTRYVGYSNDRGEASA